MTTTETKQLEIEQLIADEFGVNADYVCVLLAQFQRDRSSVDDDWRAFFDELLSSLDGASGEHTPTELSIPRSSEPSARSSAPATIQKSYDWGKEVKRPASTSAEVAPAQPVQKQAAPATASAQPAPTEP